ncbi:MAG TPA: RDD family protein, partial [Acidimicrobiales bacterium]|nr:RDD family protein [Acidimicrobiales bacterium]
MVESIPTPGVLGDIGVNVHSTPTLAGQPVFSTGVPGFGDFATGNSASGTMIVNSEAVALELGEVGIVYRTLAKLIDLVIQVTAWLILFAITSPVFLGGSLIWEAVVFWIVTGFLAVLGYPAILETATRGRTVGKLALGLRTVTVQGGPIRFRHAAIRASFELIDLWVTAGSLGMVAIVWSRRHQRFGDMVAGTIVIRQRRPGN